MPVMYSWHTQELNPLYTMTIPPYLILILMTMKVTTMFENNDENTEKNEIPELKIWS